MREKMLLAGGVANLLGALFHVVLARSIHLSASIPAEGKALLQALNVAVILVALFFAWVSLRHRRELLGSPLGRAVLGLVSLFYLVRAVEEPLLFSSSALILGACAVVAALYAVPLVARAPHREAS